MKSKSNLNTGQLRKLSCVHCRLKKLRCDRRNPCLSCTSRDQVCIYDNTTRTDAPPRTNEADHYYRERIGPDECMSANGRVLQKIRHYEQELSVLYRMLDKRNNASSSSILTDASNSDLADCSLQSAKTQSLVSQALALLPEEHVWSACLDFYLDYCNFGFYTIERKTASHHAVIVYGLRESHKKREGNVQAATIPLTIMLLIYIIALLSGFDIQSPGTRNFYRKNDYVQIRDIIIRLYKHSDILSSPTLSNLRMTLMICILFKFYGQHHEALGTMSYIYELVSLLQLDHEPGPRMDINVIHDRLQLFLTACCFDWYSATTTKAYCALREDANRHPFLFGVPTFSPLFGLRNESGDSLMDDYTKLRILLARSMRQIHERRYHPPDQTGASLAAFLQNFETLEALIDKALVLRRRTANDPVSFIVQPLHLQILLEVCRLSLFACTPSGTAIAPASGEQSANVLSSAGRSQHLTNIRLLGLRVMIIFHREMLELHRITWRPLDGCQKEEDNLEGIIDSLKANLPGLWPFLWNTLHSVSYSYSIFTIADGHLRMQQGEHFTAESDDQGLQSVEFARSFLASFGLISIASVTPAVQQFQLDCDPAREFDAYLDSILVDCTLFL